MPADVPRCYSKILAAAAAPVAADAAVEPVHAAPPAEMFLPLRLLNLRITTPFEAVSSCLEGGVPATHTT